MRRTISWMMIWVMLVSSNLPIGVAEEIAEGQSDIVEQNEEIVYEPEPENEPEITQEPEKEPKAAAPVEAPEPESEPEPVYQPEEKKEAAPTEEAGTEQEAEHESEGEPNAENEAETVNGEELETETPAPTEEATVEPTTEETIAPTNESTVEPTIEETPVPTEEPVPETQFEAGYRLCRAGTRIYTHGSLRGEHVTLEEDGLVYAYAQTEDGEGYEVAYVVDGQTEAGFVRQDNCGENLENPNKQGTTYSVDGFSGVTLPSLALEKAEDQTESPNESDADKTEEKPFDEAEQQEVPENEAETLAAGEGETAVWAAESAEEESQLAMPELTAPTEINVLQSFSVSWESVEGAESYSVELQQQKENDTWENIASGTTNDTSYTFGNATLRNAGKVRVCVSAEGQGYVKSQQATAEIEVKQREIEWAFATYPNDLYAVIAYAGSEKNVTIPTEADGQQVDGIGRNAFAHTSIQSVVMKSNIRFIDDYAFSDCSALTKIVIPTNVFIISDNAFKGSNQVTIYGYSGSEAERFAKEQNISFELLDVAETGNVDFELENDIVWQYGNAYVNVTAPDAQKVRLYVDGQLHMNASWSTEYDLTDGQARIEVGSFDELGEHTIAVAQCVNEVWGAPTPEKTITVQKAGSVQIEPIGSVKAGDKLVVRWKAIEEASGYDIIHEAGGFYKDYIDDFSAEPDEQGYITFEADGTWTEAIGEHGVCISARMNDGGYGEFTEAAYQVTGNLKKPTLTLSQTDFARNQPIKVTVTGAETEDEWLEVRIILTDEHHQYAQEFFMSGSKWNIFDYYGEYDMTVRYKQDGIWSEQSDPIRVRISGEAEPDDSVPVPDFEIVTTRNETDGSVWATFYFDEGDADVFWLYYTNDATYRCPISSGSGFLLKPGTYSYRMQAWKDGKCSKLSEAQEIVIPEQWEVEWLDVPEIAEIGELNPYTTSPVVWSWTDVEQADSYLTWIENTERSMRILTEKITDGSERTLSLFDLMSLQRLDEGEYVFCVRACKGDNVSKTAQKAFKLVKAEALAQPELESSYTILLHQMLTLELKPVEHAEKYTVKVYLKDNPNSVFFIGEANEAGPCLCSAADSLEAGDYILEVEVSADRYKSATATAELKVDYYGKLDDPELILPARVTPEHNIFTIKKVPLADDYLLSIRVQGDTVNTYHYYAKNVDTVDLEDAVELHLMGGDEPFTEGNILDITAYSCKEGYVYGQNTIQNVKVESEYDYEVKDGKAIITAYYGSKENITVPGAVGGYSVAAIGDHAFEGNQRIKYVSLPRSVTSIGAYGFKNCTELEGISGSGVTQIGREAFYGCEKLISADFRSFKGIAGEDAFKGADKLQPSAPMDIEITVTDDAGSNAYNPYIGSVIYQEGITEIPARTHYHNVNLGYVYLPSTMKKIGSQAFGDDAELKLVRLYDRVEQIADDAFEDSPNTTFQICVRDMDTVSYAEQYAIDHGIPYTKELYTPDAPATPSAGISGEGVQQTTPNEYTIPVNREVWINVTGESADTAQVYLDDTVILETEFTTGEATIQHMFTEVGDYQLYAVSANGSTESQKSPIKTLHVVGTAIQASKEKVWTCEPVELKIMSSVQTGTATLYADGERFAEAELTDGRASVTYGFRKAGTRQITAEVSGMRSIAANIEVAALAKLDAPKPEAQSIQPLENGITVNWNAVEHADGYVLRVLDTAGKVVAEEDISSTGADTYSYTMETSRLQGAGSYAVYLMDYGYQYDQNQSDSVSVLLIESGKLAFTMDKTTVQTGENVRFTVVAPGAAKIEMLVDGAANGEYELTNDVALFEKAFSQSGDREIAFRALGSEDWGEPCEAQLLHVTSIGKLDAPVISVKSVHLLGMDVTLSWQNVAHADGYSVYVYDANGNLTYQSKITETGLTVPNDAFQALGTYSLVVIAYGRGYDQAQGNAQTEVRERLAGPEIVAPSAGETLSSKDVMVIWKAVEDAAGYVITLARRAVNAAGEVVYEKVWAAPNEVIEVGAALSYTLTGLKFGQQYRVAVGALAQKGETDATKIGWSQCEFMVSLKPKKPEVTYKPTEIWPGTNVTFTITGDANTQMMDVYVIQNGEEKLIETIRNCDANFPPKAEHVFTYAYTPEQEGMITFRFVPLNEDLEFGESCYVDVPVRKEGELPPVKLLNPTQDDILLETTTVEWEKQELGGRVFGGYYVTLEQQTQDGWKAVYNQAVSDTEHTCDLPKMEAGARYKLHIYTLKKGQTVPDADTAETMAEFGYRTVPDFAITGIDSTEIIRHDVTVNWKVPQWKQNAAQKPDSYVVWWWGGGLKHNGLDGYPMQVDGDQTSCTLPAEMVKNGGSYTAEVYAILGESQTLGHGANAFTIQTPEMQIDTAVAKDDNILSGEISLSGHVSGGAETVVVTLLENDQPIAFTSGAYSGKALVLACSNHQYAATLTVANPDENKTYNIRVDGFIFPEEAAKQQNVVCTAIRRVEAGTGRITSLRLSDASVIGQWRYHSIGATKYEVYTDGRIRQILVSLDGEQTTFEPTVKKIENGQYVYEIELNLAEGVHNLSFTTNRDSTKAETHVASIRFLNAAQTAYAGMSGANVKTWPAASWSVARKLGMNTQVLQRGTCGDYAYVKVGNVNYFVLKSELMQSAYQEETEYHIVDPKQGETKLISDEQGLVVSWTPCANAVYFDVALIDAETNETLVQKTVKAAHSGEKLMASSGMAMPISNESTTFTKAEFDEDFDWLQVRPMTVTVEPYGAEN